MTRLATARIYANTGQPGAPGAGFDLQGRVIKTGSIGWRVDDRLTLCQPSDVGLQIEDFDGALWAYLEGLKTQAGFLPPWLEISVDGERRFLGLIPVDKCLRNKLESTVDLAAPDWSTMLAEAWLDGAKWMRAAPKVSINPSQTPVRPMTSAWAPLAGWRSPVPKGYPWEGFIPGRTIAVPEPANWVILKDRILITTEFDPSPREMRVVKLGTGLSPWDYGVNGGHHYAGLDPARTYTGIEVEAEIWPADWLPWRVATGTIQVVPASTADTTYYVVARDIKTDPDIPCYELPLKTVDGITVGDKLQLVHAVKRQTYEVVDVDSERTAVITREALQDLSKDDRFYFDADTQVALVHEDARSLLSRACDGVCRVNLDRFVPAALPRPVLSWLPLRTAAGDDLLAPYDCEASAASLIVHAAGRSYQGTPEAGWTALATPPERKAWWTGQLVRPPVTLLPAAPLEATPDDSRRNRGRYLRTRIQPSQAQARQVLVDYSGSRRVTLSADGRTVTSAPWSGSSWGPDVPMTWVGRPELLSIGLLPGEPTLIGISPAGLVTSDGRSLALSSKASEGAQLVATPWATYVIGLRGYGRVVSLAGALRLDWVEVIETGDGALHPASLAALDQQTLVCLACHQTLDPDDLTRTRTYTSCLLLTATPDPGSTAASATIWSEIVMDGAPRVLGALRDPSRTNRVIGHVGGRLFQVSRELPPTVERLEASGMSALELIEAVCSLHNAVACPRPDGTLEIISRMAPEQPTHLQVDEEKVIADLSAPWYSTVAVAAKEDGAYEAQGFPGGKLLEIQDHPCAITDSTRAAMAESLVQWFGRPRRRTERAWFWCDSSTPAPWENLPRWALVRINDEATTWRLVSINYDINTGEANVVLIEADALPAYGYGAE